MPNDKTFKDPFFDQMDVDAKLSVEDAENILEGLRCAVFHPVSTDVIKALNLIASDVLENAAGAIISTMDIDQDGYNSEGRYFAVAGVGTAIYLTVDFLPKKDGSVDTVTYRFSLTGMSREQTRSPD